jgi:hypothetical protein
MAEPAPAVESAPETPAHVAPTAFSGLTVALGMVFGLRLPDLTNWLSLGETSRSRFRIRPGLLRRRRDS